MLVRLAQSNQNLRRQTASASPEAPASSHFCHCPLAKISTFDPIAVLLSAISGQVEPHKMILVRAHIPQQHRRRILLRHDQIRSAHRHPHPPQSSPRGAFSCSASSPSAWLTSSKLPSPLVAQTPYLRSAAGLHNRRQIDPSIVIDIDRRHAPSPRRTRQRQVTRSNRSPHVLRPRNIPPQRQPRRARVRHRDIHPSIFVEIKNRDARRRRQASPSYRRCCGYFPSRGFTNITGAAPSPVTAISTARSLLKSVRIAAAVFPAPPNPVSARPLRERLVPVIPPQHIRRIAGLRAARPSKTDPDPRRGHNPQT